MTLSMNSVEALARVPSSRILGGILVLLALQACAAHRADELAGEYGLSSVTVAGQPFQHQVFLQQGGGKLLHVYLEGDGRPWSTGERIALDPTPDEPLMLELMAQDAAPSVFLGRPCYFNLSDPACAPVWWTDRRYSTEVVASLSRALDSLCAGYAGLVLIEHSGGGALAMLLAARRDDVRMVVTLAGNLSTRAWADEHGYTPLYGSLDPAGEPPLGPHIAQLHLLGERDTVISLSMLSAALKVQPGAETRLVPDADHSCCWSKLWPQVLSEVQAATASPAGQVFKTPNDHPG